MRMLDAGTLRTSVTFEDGVELCETLKLVETMQHGNDHYMRLTQKGVDVVATLVQLLQNQAEAAAAGDILKGS